MLNILLSQMLLLYKLPQFLMLLYLSIYCNKCCLSCFRWLHCLCDQIRTEADAERCAEDGYNCVLCRPRDVPPPHLLPPPPPPKPPTPTKSPGNQSGYSGRQYDIVNRSMQRMQEIVSKLEPVFSGRRPVSKGIRI